MASTYSNTLCGCFSNINICCYGMFCPCCLKADTWAKFNGINCNCYQIFHPNSGFWNRQFYRSAYGMEQNYLGDCIIFCLCCPCANCQDSREVRQRLSIQQET